MSGEPYHGLARVVRRMLWSGNVGGSEQLNTPVALMMFNRPDLTAQVFEAIRAARPKRLLVVADGPRNDAERVRCLETRAVIKVDWPCDLETNYSEQNLGCKRRVGTGISWVFEQCEDAIILEDDTLPSPSFFPYCQTLLERYRDDERVMCISGMNLVRDPRPRGSETYHFSRYGATNGWATWRRAWCHWDIDMKAWPAFKRSGRIKDLFQDRVEQWFWTLLFDEQYQGRINTWDYQWLFARLAQGGLTATPIVNMVANLGFRADGTHTAFAMPKAWEAALHHHDLWNLVEPEYVVPNRDMDDYYFHEIWNPRGAAGVAMYGLKQLVERWRPGRTR
jgi:hypothetical protein